MTGNFRNISLDILYEFFFFFLNLSNRQLSSFCVNAFFFPTQEKKGELIDTEVDESKVTFLLLLSIKNKKPKDVF